MISDNVMPSKWQQLNFVQDSSQPTVTPTLTPEVISAVIAPPEYLVDELRILLQVQQQAAIESPFDLMTDARAVEDFHVAATIALGGEDRMHQWALVLLKLLPISVIQDVLESRLQRADAALLITNPTVTPVVVLLSPDALSLSGSSDPIVIITGLWFILLFVIYCYQRSNAKLNMIYSGRMVIKTTITTIIFLIISTHLFH